MFHTYSARGMTLKNRVVMMPMGSDFAGHDGELSDEHIKYYELRARGGTGLIMVEMSVYSVARGARVPPFLGVRRGGGGGGAGGGGGGGAGRGGGGGGGGGAPPGRPTRCRDNHHRNDAVIGNGAGRIW
ncbi:MAG: hypothetical protein V8R24_06185 [Dorea longicatena]